MRIGSARSTALIVGLVFGSLGTVGRAQTPPGVEIEGAGNSQTSILSPGEAGVRRGGPNRFRRGALELLVQGPVLSMAVRDLPVIGAAAAAPREDRESDPPQRETVVDESGVRYGTLAPKRRDALAGRSSTRAPGGRTASTTFDWEGIGNFAGNIFFPDTEGAVGPGHYVQVVNVSFTVYNKSGIALIGVINTNLLWSGFGGPCETENHGSAIVMYDEQANRWVFAQHAVPGGQERVCFAVSTTGDPTGTYNLYEVVTQRYPDSPKIGVWPDSVNNAYFMGTNSGGQGPGDVYALDRASMLAGTATRAAQYFQGYESLLMPADIDGPDAPPPGTPGLFYTIVDGGESYFGSPAPAADAIRIYEFSVDWNTPANSTFTFAQELTAPDEITDFNWTVCGLGVFDCLSQPSPGNAIDSASWWPMQRLQYRNFGSYETLVGTWTVDVLADGDHAAPRWFDLRRTSSEWTVYQEGTHAPDDAHRWLGSTAMDAGGNIALGYNVVDASAGIFPSIRYAARLASEPVGTLQAEATLIAGTGAMTGGLNRWGNYSSTEIDPADGCTFFHTNEYIATTGSLTWQTRVGAFTLSECQLDTYTLYTDPASLAVCRGDDAVFEIAVGSVNGFANSVSFAQTGAPPGISVGFSANPLTPPGSSTMTFTDTAAVAPGTYSLDVFGAAVNPDSPPATLDRSNRLTLIVGDPLTAGPTLQQPPNGAVEISSIPTTFQWDAIAGVAQYTIAIATDAAFTNLVETAAVAETSYTASLAPSKTYYWRVRGENACGIGPYSTAFSFTILAVSCTTFASTDVPKLILEISTPSVMSTVGVATTGTVADVNVLNLAGTHTRVSDLDFNLISPASSAVQFFVPGCDDTDDFDIDLDDESDRAAGSWPCPPTDGLTYQPNSSLSVFDGEGSNGTWTLRVDDSVLFAGGSLDSWGLEICVLSCGQSDVILTDLTVADSQAHTACNSITVGPNVTVEATGRLDLSAPSIVLTNDVSILGEASLSAD